MIHLRVAFSDGAAVLEEGFTLRDPASLAQVKQQILRRLGALNRMADVDARLSPGPIPEAPPPAPETSEEKAKKLWFQNWSRLRFADELITAGILSGTEPGYLSLKQWLKENFQISYV